MEMMQVITAIIATAKSTLIILPEEKTLTGTATKVIPTARASILVAIAIINIVFTSNPGLASSGGPKDSLIILPPIRVSRINATQGATAVIRFSNLEPTRYPIKGIKP